MATISTFGVLVNQKDTVDYMLPGIMGYGFDFGYLGLIGLMVFVLGTIIIGFKILKIYRQKREKNNRKIFRKRGFINWTFNSFYFSSFLNWVIYI